MGVLDKFLNVLKLNDDDYDDDDFLDDEEDLEDEERPPKRKLFARAAEEDDEDFLDDDDDEVNPVRKAKTQKAAAARQPVSKVTPMRSPSTPARKPAASGMEVCVIKPNSMEDTREITETLITNRTVVLNLEGIDIDIAQRIIDFTSGSCYAVAGNLQKISSYIFIVTPASVDISGDFQEIISGAFDIPSIHTGY